MQRCAPVQRSARNSAGAVRDNRGRLGRERRHGVVAGDRLHENGVLIDLVDFWQQCGVGLGRGLPVRL